MKQAICALKAAFGVRTNAICPFQWNWWVYHSV